MHTQKLLTDWRRFIRHGFRYADFSDDIYHHLVTGGGFAEVAHGYNYTADEPSKHAFWGSYFDEGFSWLVGFIEQFGGSLDAVEGFDNEWLALDPARNRALIEEMQLIYPALVDVLLEREDAIYADYKDYNLENMEAEDGVWTTEQRAVASQAYDRDFYYYGGQEIFDYDGIDDELRERLAAAVAAYVSPNAVATLFEAASPAGALAPRSAQETLFSARRTRRRDHQRLAEATTQRHSAPVPAATAVTPADVAQYRAMRAVG